MVLFVYSPNSQFDIMGSYVPEGQNMYLFIFEITCSETQGNQLLLLLSVLSPNCNLQTMMKCLCFILTVA